LFVEYKFINNCLYREIELRENLVGTGFIEPPQQAVKRVGKKIMKQSQEEMEHRVTVLGEVVKASGFQAENTYIMFEVLLPSFGWIFEDVNEYEMYGIIRDTTVEYNKRNSVTHISKGVTVKTNDN
jgi:hypothetical protein